VDFLTQAPAKLFTVYANRYANHSVWIFFKQNEFRIIY